MESCVDLAALHGYLSGDGCVVKNPPGQSHKYYRVDFRNTEPVLLRDFQERFETIFLEIPVISRRQDRCTKSSKGAYEFFTTKFGSFYSREWRMPEMTDECASAWLRAFFDCEGWVVNLPAKDRSIGIESVNLPGLLQVKDALESRFGIQTSIPVKKKNHAIYSLRISGRVNLRKFHERVDFLHPQKRRKLDGALASYELWRWVFPAEPEARRAYVKELVARKASFERLRARVYSREENLRNLAAALQELGINTTISRSVNGKGTPYYELAVCGRDNLDRLRALSTPVSF